MTSRILKSKKINMAKMGIIKGQIKNMVYNLNEFFCNATINKIPFQVLRKLFYRFFGMDIGKDSIIFRNSEVLGIKNVKIGNNSIINHHCFLDGRGGLTIGENVNISNHVLLITGSHDINSKDFKTFFNKIIIEDYVWICTGAIVLPGVTLSKGSVVGAGAVVTRDVPPFTIVGGIPARIIGRRNENANYKLSYTGWSYFY